jgi:hypothetical protein
MIFTGFFFIISYNGINMKEKNRSWYKLDNAGKLYPALLDSRETTLFRLTAVLDSYIHVGRLSTALKAVMKRFPYYNVNLMRGAFWYYFNESPRMPLIEQDSRYPCMKMAIRKRTRYPFRVRAFGKRISVEFSHILTDATGALNFLNALLGEYISLQEDIHGPLDGVMYKGRAPHPEEFEDAFVRYLDKNIPQPRKDPKAFQFRGIKVPRGIYWVTTGFVPFESLNRVAKERSLTITEYLTAVMMEVYQDYLYDLPERERKRLAAPIAICVPVNLRRIFPSRTMRNFFLSVTPFIDPRLGRYEFDEICDKVMHFMRFDMDKKFLSQQISRNVKGEMNLAARLLPVPLKDLILPIIYQNIGQSTYSTVLSNLGNVTLPQEIANHVENIIFTPNPPSGNISIKLGVAGYKDRISITFGRITHSSELEREFFRKLRKRGIPVKVESNIS